MNSVFTYTDYRDFLRDHFEKAKKEHSHYSLRYVSQKTGVDPSFYAKILKREKHLGDDSVEAVKSILNFTHSNEAEYFTTLVHFTKTKNKKVRERLLDHLLMLRESTAHPIDDFYYFSKWYIIPVREMLAVYNIRKEDVTHLGSRFLHPLSEEEVREAVHILENLSMIGPDSSGYLKPRRDFVSTGDQWQSLGVRAFQKKMMALGSEALESTPREERDISTLTVSIDTEALPRIKKRLSRARKDIMHVVGECENPDRVYQINMQVFPLTKGEDS
ncbi:TIGR02147 family protein [Chitinivibrio alkaliphilus]|uniref:DUF4423 domain-containing protein n=1 Tax=Chitinivibrio alkaliphilus ACht1 TaxID=1313304 RepID=U7DAJ1_9BACT|nr:TIGR02147 family protein [Chitinivibrio alkaliphilus]ERP39047.1 hypothetical protein CALK_0541 [Chitinivibrio alkaliphilus ACht1]